MQSCVANLFKDRGRLMKTDMSWICWIIYRLHWTTTYSLWRCWSTRPAIDNNTFIKDHNGEGFGICQTLREWDKIGRRLSDKLWLSILADKWEWGMNRVITYRREDWGTLFGEPVKSQIKPGWLVVEKIISSPRERWCRFIWSLRDCQKK